MKHTAEIKKHATLFVAGELRGRLAPGFTVITGKAGKLSKTHVLTIKSCLPSWHRKEQQHARDAKQMPNCRMGPKVFCSLERD